MITVMGATGNTGRKIAETLLNAGENVRALGRSESKLAELKREGAEVCIGDTNDAAFLARAFRGADAIYTLLPTDRRAPDYRAEQDRQGEAIARAIRESGVRYVVALSSVGADLSEGTGVIAGCTPRKNVSSGSPARMCCSFVQSRSTRTSTTRSRSFSTRESTRTPSRRTSPSR
jgi:nucleoside-diphosphate-sugar epimerase